MAAPIRLHLSAYEVAFLPNSFNEWLLCWFHDTAMATWPAGALRVIAYSGWRAYDAEDDLVGYFTTQTEAAAALLNAAEVMD